MSRCALKRPSSSSDWQMMMIKPGRFTLWLLQYWSWSTFPLGYPTTYLYSSCVTHVIFQRRVEARDSRRTKLSLPSPLVWDGEKVVRGRGKSWWKSGVPLSWICRPISGAVPTQSVFSRSNPTGPIQYSTFYFILSMKLYVCSFVSNTWTESRMLVWRLFKDLISFWLRWKVLFVDYIECRIK